MRDAVSVTPSLDAETRTALQLLVLTAQRDLPHLAVAVTPNTNGRQWLVDRCCSRIWVSATLTGELLLAAVTAAIAVLVDYLSRRPGIPQQRCNSPAYV